MLSPTPLHTDYDTGKGFGAALGFAMCEAHCKPMCREVGDMSLHRCMYGATPQLSLICTMIYQGGDTSRTCSARGVMYGLPNIATNSVFSYCSTYRAGVI